MRELRDISGNIFSSQVDIENCFIQFYENLWSSTTSHNADFLFNALPDDLPTLTDMDRELLSMPFSKEEVYKTLKSMPSGKSPGTEGLNSEFYLFYWNIVGDHLFKAISFFFNSGQLPSSWGKTYVALIPKKPNPTSVSDFRPISLCNVCYKIITKMLANRLKRVIHKLIGPEQSGFIPGRGAFDNIITAQEIVHSIENENGTPLP